MDVEYPMDEFETITTDEEFNDALNGLVQSAYANDVDVEGGSERSR